MEALLSLAFDNIASKDTQKIRKGLRQIEGMLAQICLSGAKTKPSTPGHRRNASAINLGEQQQATPKKLGRLAEDLAFREFFRLQEGFEWNGTSPAGLDKSMRLLTAERSGNTSGRLPRTAPWHGQQ